MSGARVGRPSDTCHPPVRYSQEEHLSLLAMPNGRERAYVAKPGEALKARLAAAQAARLFIVQTPGPTSFVLREEGSRKKHRVSIGSVNYCTCGSREQPCVHVAFVMLRVFRLAPGDSRCWQASLIDRELEELVESRARSVARAALASRDWGAAPTCGECAPDAESSHVARRPLDDAEDADPCPICYEEIGAADDEAGALDWCRKSCGKSVHRRCFAMWAEHQQSIGQKLTCPHCRGEWAGEPLPPPRETASAGQRSAPAGRQARGEAQPTGSSAGGGGVDVAPGRRVAVHREARCKSCHVMGIRGVRYRCLVCKPETELCGECFDSCMHPHHPFAARERPKGPWTVARCRADDVVPAETAVATGSGGGSGGSSPLGASAGGDNSAQLAAALAELQHREITPEDYELLMALSQDGGRSLALPSQPNTAGLIAAANGGGARGGVRSRDGGRRAPTLPAPAAPGAVATLASRLVAYDPSQLAPLVDELNEIEAEAAEARKAAKEAAEPPTLLSGRAVSMVPRSVGGELPHAGRARPAPFGSTAAARPWQHHRADMSVAADRRAAERMAASAGVGFEDLGLAGTGISAATGRGSSRELSSNVAAVAAPRTIEHGRRRAVGAASTGRATGLAGVGAAHGRESPVLEGVGMLSAAPIDISNGPTSGGSSRRGVRANEPDVLARGAARAREHSVASAAALDISAGPGVGGLSLAAEGLSLGTRVRGGTTQLR